MLKQRLKSKKYEPRYSILRNDILRIVMFSILCSTDVMFQVKLDQHTSQENDILRTKSYIILHDIYTETIQCYGEKMDHDFRIYFGAERSILKVLHLILLNQ